MPGRRVNSADNPSLAMDHDSARLRPEPTPGMGLSKASWRTYSRRYGEVVASPSAGTSQRVTGLKCIAKVRVPSGAPDERDALVTNSSPVRTGMQPRVNRDIAWRSSLSAIGTRAHRDACDAPMVLDAPRGR